MTFVALLLSAVLASSCISEKTGVEPCPVYGDDALAVAPMLLSPEMAGMASKAKDDDDVTIIAGDEVNAREALRENIISKLDVFVKKSSATDDESWFRTYHLAAAQEGVILDPSNSESLLNRAEQLLAERWADDGYVPDEEYDIYVTANNDVTSDVSNAPGSLAELKALSTYNFNVYRYYLDRTPEARQSHTQDKKLFLMDGKVEGWKVDPDSPRQVFEPVLRRAAAKIIVNVSYSEVETIDMISEDGQTLRVAKQDSDGNEVTDADGNTVYEDVDLTQAGDRKPKKGTLSEYLEFVGRKAGVPAWKFVNFSLRTSDIADGDFVVGGDLSPFKSDKKDEATLQTWSSNFQVNSMSPEGTPNLKSEYRIVTYSYATDWSSDRDNAPYILYSIGYSKDAVDGDGNIIYEADGVTPKQDTRIYYYRIPVCDESAVSSLNRNNIYIVNAKIASLGSSSETLELPDEQLRIEYHVIPWTETVMAQEATVVKAQDIKYLTVSPVTYTLKGDGTQSVDLLWYASASPVDGRYVDIDHTSITNTSIDVYYTNYLGNDIHFYGSSSSNATRGSISRTSAASDGSADIVYTCAAPTGTYANGETVKITIKTDGRITVESQALDSRAVKTIKFRVKLTTTGLYEDIVIKHFPLDNIQSIAGSWSSRWEKYEYTFDKTTADSWPDGYKTETVYVQEEITQAQFRAGVPADNRGQNYTSTNPYESSDGYYYFGSGQSTNSYITYSYNKSLRNDYDRFIEYTNYDLYYNYTSWFRLSPETRYYHPLNSGKPSTGEWVDWERDNGNTYSASDVKYTEGNSFIAKVYNESDQKIYAINVTRQTSGGAYTYTYSRATSQEAQRYNTYNESTGYVASRNSAFTSLTNNKMYVIQVTSVSNKYVLGTPIISESGTSQDKLVSPAFMIASQLGATVNFTTAASATSHCSTYMEVGLDGTRYVGWRLPTEQEIDFIIDYQKTTSTAYNKSITPVLTGYGYWALTGNKKYTTYTDQGDNRVRCVRDLSVVEIKKLNGEQ